MKERSSELRSVLVESVDPKQVESALEKDVSNDFIDTDRVQELVFQFDAEQEYLQSLEARHQELSDVYPYLSEQEFEETYEALKQEVDQTLKRIRRRSYQEGEYRPYTVDFVDISTVESLDDFLETFPMQFVPRKQEIGRILAVAKQMHIERLKRGEIAEGDPIRIVDIGGANGVLGKLITDLAQENGLVVEYQIVDPDAPTVRASKEFYKNHPALSFQEQTGFDFTQEQYADDPAISELIHRQNELLKEAKRKVADIERVVEDIQQQYKKSRLNEDSIELYQHILKKDFGMTTTIFPHEPERFVRFFETNYLEKPAISFKEKYVAMLNGPILELTKQIDEMLSERPARHDLVLNSWMPVKMDFSKDVRRANGAAIIYMLEQYGATGCRSDAAFPETPSRPGEEESYNPGSGYETKQGWISHSTPQVKSMRTSPHKTFLESDSSDVRPFSNAFLVQSKKGYAPHGVVSSPFQMDVTVTGFYPWEKELVEKGGELAPVIPLPDKEGNVNYLGPLKHLTDQLVKHALLQKQKGFKPML